MNEKLSYKLGVNPCVAVNKYYVTIEGYAKVYIVESYSAESAAMGVANHLRAEIGTGWTALCTKSTMPQFGKVAR